jgi:hypothetical protein
MEVAVSISAARAQCILLCSCSYTVVTRFVLALVPYNGHGLDHEDLSLAFISFSTFEPSA